MVSYAYSYRTPRVNHFLDSVENRRRRKKKQDAVERVFSPPASLPLLLRLRSAWGTSIDVFIVFRLTNTHIHTYTMHTRHKAISFSHHPCSFYSTPYPFILPIVLTVSEKIPDLSIEILIDESSYDKSLETN